MGLRFRRRFGIMPGVSLNISRSQALPPRLAPAAPSSTSAGEAPERRSACRDPVLAGRPHAGPGARRTGRERAAAIIMAVIIFALIVGAVIVEL